MINLKSTFFKAEKSKNMELMGGPGYSIEINLFTLADLDADEVYEIGVRKGSGKTAIT